MVMTLVPMFRFTCAARQLAVLLCIAMLVAACGRSEPADESAAATAPAEETSTPQPAAEPTAAPAPTAAASATASPTPTALVEPTSDPSETVEPAAPADFSQRGPYSVGVTTLRLDDRDVEVWYPVDANDVTGLATEVFDALTAFPPDLRAIIPPELSGEYDTLAVRDAAALRQAFPVMIYGHGFGGYRQIATHFTTHIASWGFVVASADHLERGIAEQTLDLVGAGLFDESTARPDAAVEDVRNTMDLLAQANIDGPLAGTMNLDQLAVSGHSAGAFAAVQAASVEPDRIDAWISIAGGTRDGIELTQPGVVLIGELDAVVPAERSYELVDSVDDVALVVVNIQGAGHNSFTDPCRGITDLGGLGALAALLGEEQVARAEDGCTPGSTEPEIAQAVQNHVITAFLMDVFERSDIGDALTSKNVAGVGPLADYQAPGES